VEDRLFLHDGERLLLSMTPSVARLFTDWLRGIGEALVLCVLLIGTLAVASFLFLNNGIPPWVFIMLCVMVFALVLYRRWKLWSHSLFRVTTERILGHHHHSLFFGEPLRTIKWTQYQESFLGTRNFFDVLLRSRGICVRYGTADTKETMCFPSLPYAQDIKHFLDKVDSSVRKQQESQLRPFVSAARGKRNPSEQV